MSLSKLRRQVSFSRCSPWFGLTSVPQEDGGTQSETSSGYTGRQLALVKQLHDQHKYLSPVPADIICKLWSHPVCNALGAVHTQGTRTKVHRICTGLQNHLHVEATDSVSCILKSGSPSYFSCSTSQQQLNYIFFVERDGEQPSTLKKAEEDICYSRASQCQSKETIKILPSRMRQNSYN